MARYIDADALIKALDELQKPHDIGFGETSCLVAINLYSLNNLIKDLPTADVVEVVHGEWIRKADWKDLPTVCNQCKHEFTEYVIGYEWEETGDLPNFCPHCGARMDGGR